MYIKKYLPILSGLVTSTIFGFSFLFTKEGFEILEPFHLLAFRFLFAALILTLLRILGVIKISYKGKKVQLLLLLALFQPVLYFVFESLGIDRTTSSESGLMIALIPIAATVMSAFILKEKPSRSQIGFILLSFTGVIFIILMKSGFTFGSSSIGMLLLLGAVISAAIYNILSRKLSQDFTSIEITYTMMWVAAIFFNLLAIIEKINTFTINTYFEPLLHTKAIITIIYLGGLSSVVAFFLLNFILSKLPVTKATVMANLTTIISIIAGVVFRNEAFYWFHIVGAIMILTGVWGTMRMSRERSC